MDCQNISNDFAGTRYQGPEFVRTRADAAYPEGRWGVLYQGTQGVHGIFLDADGWKHDVDGVPLVDGSGAPLPSMITLVDSGLDPTGIMPLFQQLNSNTFSVGRGISVCQSACVGYLSGEYVTDLRPVLLSIGYTIPTPGAMSLHPSEEGTVIFTANDGFGWALFQVSVDGTGWVTEPIRLTLYRPQIEMITALAAVIHPATGKLAVYAGRREPGRIAVWEGEANGSRLDLINYFDNLFFEPTHFRAESDINGDVVYIHMLDRKGLNRGSYALVHTLTAVKAPLFLHERGPGAEAIIENGELVLYFKEWQDGHLRMMRASGFDGLE
jgi:hypothetical protein